MTAGRELTKKDIISETCKLSCCFSCSFCNQASTKERSKSRIDRCKFQKLLIKICQRYFFCHSLVLCKTCNKCQTCCTKSACRGQTSKLLANLAGSGCRSESCSNSVRGLYPPFSGPAKTRKVSHSHKLLCHSPQEQLPPRGIASAYRQKCSGVSTRPNISGGFQPTIFGSKAQQQVETYIRSDQTESFPQGGKIQNGDTGNDQDIPPTRGTGHLHRFQRRLLPYTNTGTVQEVSQISCPGSDLPVQSSAFRSVHSTLGVHCSSKRGETDGHTQGYKDPPVPRRLVGEGQIPPGLSPAYSGSSKICQELGWMVNLEKSELEPKQIFNFVGYQFDLRVGRTTNTGPLAEPTGQNNRNTVTTGLSGLAVHVPDSFVNSHREASSPRPTTHETHTVASQKQLEGTRITRKGDSNSQVPALPLTMVAKGRQHSHRSTITPNKACQPD